MILVNEIKEIIFEFIEKEYENYLKMQKILLIRNANVRQVIDKLYDENIKNIKTNVRVILKDRYKETYSTASVESILLDIFMDREMNINKLVDQILFIQNKNFAKVSMPIVDGALGLKISIRDNFIVLGGGGEGGVVGNYKFLYSINDKILEEYDNKEKINIIKTEISGKNSVELGLYYLLDNNLESL
jgi:hypothetical protein